MNTYQRLCDCCGASFVGGHPRAKWCSFKCKAKAAYHRRVQRIKGVAVFQPDLTGDEDLELPAIWAMASQKDGTDQREWNGTAIQRRQSDGFVNATAMAKANDKHLPHYMANERTREYLQALSRSVGIPTDQLAVSTMTGANELRGTWIHPRLAVDLARWISPAFAVWMDGWFLESLTQPQQTQPQQPKLAPGVHVVADNYRDMHRMWSAALRSELMATLDTMMREDHGTTDLPVPKFHYHVGR